MLPASQDGHEFLGRSEQIKVRGMRIAGEIERAPSQGPLR